MSRKPSRPKFNAGEPVRVKRGVDDPDFPDVPIGGWSGTVTEVYEGEPPNYLICWNQRTLDAQHPVFKTRCERDGFDYEEMELDEDSLEPDRGEVMEIEQPQSIQTPPLDPHEQDDRIRAVFGLTHDDPLPEVSLGTLRTYHGNLVKNLSFPFDAEWEAESGMISSKAQKVTILGLGDPDEETRIDDSYGLIGEIQIERKRSDAPLAEMRIKKRGPNKTLVEDYGYWFWNWG